jgi:CheY-like chemotaxis protein
MHTNTRTCLVATADDETFERFAQVLEACDTRFIRERNGAAALDLLRTRRYDLVVLDDALPRLTDLDLSWICLGLGFLRHPVVVVGHEPQCSEACVASLPRPVDTWSIHDALERVGWHVPAESPAD